MPRASHRESKQERNQKNANRIVPVEKLETIALDAFVSVGPRSPANGARDHHQQRNAQDSMV